ncbi:hypothetical protein COCVIDRAFT_103126 [Bipolaris victoriae FI3]|uniref:Uncharacterized protein n=1 Tax=Bipolaris victoriae (strain FI3) TaxID=930091 RepID=W7E569_BIPV3|nr:hypothetical protein COCVIDRAFT_103126 [Bipolaris victoriae FI3]
MRHNALLFHSPHASSALLYPQPLPLPAVRPSKRILSSVQTHRDSTQRAVRPVVDTALGAPASHKGHRDCSRFAPASSSPQPTAPASQRARAGDDDVFFLPSVAGP